jgi:tetratricopeptide (TPR) repeat protein
MPFYKEVLRYQLNRMISIKKHISFSLVAIALLSFLMLFSGNSAVAGNHRTDSLLKIVANPNKACSSCNADTVKIIALNNLCFELISLGEFDEALTYALEALKYIQNLKKRDKTIDKSWFDSAVANCNNNIGQIYSVQGQFDKALKHLDAAMESRQKALDLKGEAATLINIGIVFQNKGDFEKALEHFNRSLYLRQQIKDKKGIANAFTNIGNIHYNNGNFSLALENYISALKIDKSIGNLKGEAASYNNIGAIYFSQGNFEKALENFSASLKIEQKLGDKRGIADSYGNLGNVYASNKQYVEAAKEFQKSLKLNDEIGDKKSLASLYNNLGLLAYLQGKSEEAQVNYLKSLQIRQEIGDKNGISRSFINIGDIHFENGKLDDARSFYHKSLLVSKETGSSEAIKKAYFKLAQVEKETGNWKAAYLNYQDYVQLKDSLSDVQSAEKMAEMQTLYESDKKETQIKLLEKDNELAQTTNKKQRIIIYSVVIGLALMLILVGVIFKALQNNKKKNRIISKQKEEIEHKQKEITASITYALRLQQAILPPLQQIKEAFPESFLLYLPKDIVSGDFYWFYRNAENILIAAADCTGHGVPGALTSMVCSERLNESVKATLSPGELLKSVNKGVKSSLRQEASKDSTRDGMDIALCAFDHTFSKLTFSGANRPLWIIRNNQKQIEEIKSTKKAIGGTTEDNQEFSNHEVMLQKGDVVYLFSDGYIDQFGGDTGKKFMAQRLKDSLLQIAHLPMDQQYERLKENFYKWKGNLEQVDDVLVVGLKVV